MSNQSKTNVSIYFKFSKKNQTKKQLSSSSVGLLGLLVKVVEVYPECTKVMNGVILVCAGGHEMMRPISLYYYPTSRFRASKGNSIDDTC